VRTVDVFENRALIERPPSLMVCWAEVEAGHHGRVVLMATHSKTRRAVQRLRRLARRRREAELKKARQSGTENRAAPPRG